MFQLVQNVISCRPLEADLYTNAPYQIISATHTIIYTWVSKLQAALASQEDYLQCIFQEENDYHRVVLNMDLRGIYTCGIMFV